MGEMLINSDKIEKINNSLFMTNSEINKVYEGKWVLVQTKSKGEGIFNGGFVSAVADDTEENEEYLWNALEKQLNGIGYVHYAHIDRGDDLHVVFGKIE
jgi:hypothetical protein